jgi:hypothetical protein
MKSFILILTITIAASTAQAEGITTQSVAPVPAPELNVGNIAGAMTLLVGGLLILAARRKQT